MLARMMNLRCRAGHWHYSPQPHLWVGRECWHTKDDQLRLDMEQRRRTDRCRLPLRPAVR